MIFGSELKQTKKPMRITKATTINYFLLYGFLLLLQVWNLAIADERTALKILCSCFALLTIIMRVFGLIQSALNPTIPNFLMNASLIELMFALDSQYSNLIYVTFVMSNLLELTIKDQKNYFIFAGVNVSQLVIKLIWGSIGKFDGINFVGQLTCVIIVSLQVRLIYIQNYIEISLPTKSSSDHTIGSTHAPIQTQKLSQNLNLEVISRPSESEQVLISHRDLEYFPEFVLKMFNIINDGLVIFNGDSDIIFSNDSARQLFKVNNNADLFVSLSQRKEKLFTLQHRDSLHQQLPQNNDSGINIQYGSRDFGQKPTQLQRLIWKRQTITYNMNQRSMSALRSLNMIQKEDESSHQGRYQKVSQQFSIMPSQDEEGPQVELKVQQIEVGKGHKVKILIIRDKTPKVKSKEIKLIHQFNHLLLNSFSHELRTPLNCSFQLLEALMMETCDEQLKSKYIQPIISTNHLLLHQINDILDYAAFESDNFQYSIHKFELNRMLDKVVSLFKNGCELKRISIMIENNFQKMYIRSDPKRISQVLVNLMNNAVKFTNYEGKIVLRVLSQQGFISIQVRDDGIGIENNRLLMIRKVLNEQGQDITREGYIGLGLKVSNMIVRGLNHMRINQNYLEIDSARGFGTTVQFTISDQSDSSGGNDWMDQSLDDSQNRLSNLMSGLGENPFFASKSMFQFCKIHPSILIVDDVSFNVMALKVLLQKKQLTTEECYNGQDAYNKVIHRYNHVTCELQQCKFFKFILMDIEMPVMDGITATEQILAYLRRVDCTNPTRVIICSAYDSSENILSTKSVGASGFLPKPIEKDRLFELITELQ